MDQEAEPLFRNRTPEAAARQLATVLAWAVNCELTTLEALRKRKGTSRSDLARHEEICRLAVFHRVDLGIDPLGLDDSTRLFRDRVPSAAARQIATVLAWATECQLATLEALQERRSTSKGLLARQEDTCRRLVAHCRDFGLRPSGLGGQLCTRLAAALKDVVPA